MNPVKILAISTALFFSGLHLTSFAQQVPTTPAVSAGAEKKQVQLNEDEINSLLAGKKVSYQTPARVCRMDIDKDKTLVDYCGAYSDKGTWFIKDTANGKAKQFCRVYAKEKDVDRCSVVVKSEDGDYFFGTSQATQRKIVKVEPL